MAEKKAFSFYRNYYDILKGLSPSQRSDFIMALTSVMFFEQHIDDIRFDDGVLGIVWASIKYQVKQSLDGFCSKNKIEYNHIVTTPPQGGCQGGCQAPCQQEKEEEKGEEKEKDKNTMSAKAKKLPPTAHVKKDDLISIFDFLNEKTGRHFRPFDANGNMTKAGKLLKDRMKSGVEIPKIYAMIAIRCRKWKGKDMEEYLRPSTLFNATKFEDYIAEVGE